MFPLRDDNPTEIFPIVTVLLIAATGAAWWYLQGAGLTEEALVGSVCALGAIPAEVTDWLARTTGWSPGWAGASGGAGAPGAAGVAGRSGPCELGGLTWQALFTSMFMHGGWMHLIGNLWFLWIFGNNIEDSMGHLRFVVFYLVTGLAAAMAHVLTAPGSTVPMVGASGAISGIMGAYLVLYPRARVDTLFFFFVFIRVIPLPAWLMLGYWMLLQIAGSAATAAVGGGGVAYAAHIGGFLAGVALIFVFRNPRLVDAKRQGVVLPRGEIEHGGWW